MGVFRNLNYIKNIYRHPCGVPTVDILIETALPAAAMAVMEIFTFGCRDIMKMRMGKTPWHSRALKGLLKGVTGGVKIGPRLFGFSTPFMAIDAGLQYLLYADAITGFIANWMSLIYQEQGCISPGAGFMSCGLSSIYEGAGDNKGIFINCLESRPCAIIGGNTIQIPAGCTGTISWTCHFEPFHGNPLNQGSVTTWLESLTDGTRYSEQPGYSQPGGKQVTGGGAKIRNPAPSVAQGYKLKWSCSGGLMGCTSGTVSISGYGRKMPLVPAGCSPNDYDQPYPHDPVPRDQPGPANPPKHRPKRPAKGPSPKKPKPKNPRPPKPRKPRRNKH